MTSIDTNIFVYFAAPSLVCLCLIVLVHNHQLQHLNWIQSEETAQTVDATVCFVKSYVKEGKNMSKVIKII